MPPVTCPDIFMKSFRWLFLLIALAVGIGAGLLYGWYVDPVEFFDLTPDTLFTFGMDYQNIKPRGASWTGNPYYFSNYTKTDFRGVRVTYRFNKGTTEDSAKRAFEYLGARLKRG